MVDVKKCLVEGTKKGLAASAGMTVGVILGGPVGAVTGAIVGMIGSDLANRKKE